MNVRGTRILVALSFVATSLATFGLGSATPASAEGGPCRLLADGTWYCEHGTGDTPPPSGGGSTTPDTGGDSGGGGGGGGGYPPGSCIWIPFPDQSIKETLYPDAQPDEVVVYYVCNLGTAADPVWAEPYTMTSTRLVGPDEAIGPAPVAMPPGAVAAAFWIDVKAGLAVPDPVTSPPSGTAAIIDQPTFMAVENWPGATDLHPETCHPTGTCVRLDLEPQLYYETGVGGVDPIACAGGGTVFDPAGPPPDVQAEGACAYTYTARTGVAGRPEAYEPRARIHWTAGWVETTGGATGVTGSLQEFDVTSAPLVRPVDEVQGIVVESDEGVG